MGKHKKTKKDEEEEVPKAAGLRLILKVGGSATPEQSESPAPPNRTEDVAPSSPEAVEKHKKKKKEKKKKKDKKGEKKEKKHKHKDKKKEKDDSSQDESMVDEPMDVSAPSQPQAEAAAPPAPAPVPTAAPAPPVVQQIPVLPMPVPVSPTNRDRRSCVVKNIKEKTGLQKLLELLLSELEKKDPKQFFAWPVTDAIAPGYSSVIKQPMDFSTIRGKVEEGKYANINQMLADFELICTNAMIYNQPETIYFKTAKKVHLAGLRLFQPERVRAFLRDIPHILTAEELGFDPMYERNAADVPALEDEDMDVLDVNETARETFMLSERNPFEPVPDNMTPSEILEQAQAAAAQAAQRLREQNPQGKVGFLRQKKDGTTSLAILNPGDSIDPSTLERPVSLGSLLPKLLPGQGTSRLDPVREDRRNLIKTVKPLNYGPFGSYLPSYDSTFANVTKQESEMIYQTYGDETGVQYAESILDYVRDCDYALNIVDDLLSLMTGREHAKVIRLLSEKRKAQALSIEEEHMLQQVEMMQKLSGKGATKSPQKNDAASEPDISSLRSLSSFGIDTSFLDSLEQDMKPSRTVQTKLNDTGRLLARLEKVQKDRLSGPLPVHLANVPKPSEMEIQLAEGVTEGISQVAKFAPPEAVASLHGVRKAMGIDVAPPVPATSSDAKSSLDRELEKILGEESIVNNASAGQVLNEIFS